MRLGSLVKERFRKMIVDCDRLEVLRVWVRPLEKFDCPAKGSPNQGDCPNSHLPTYIDATIPRGFFDRIGLVRRLRL